MTNEKATGMKLWFPFTTQEVSFIIGIVGFTVGLLSRAGVSDTQLALGSLATLLICYFTGLLVYSRREKSPYRFIPDGGLRGDGYAAAFSKAKKTLLLTHVDDDSPSDELNVIYNRILKSGVKMRRLVFVREDAKKDAYSWIADFPSDKNLEHRYVRGADIGVMRFSFVVVDSECVLISLPGFETIDAFEYSGEFILRHLVEISDENAAKVYEQIHKELWAKAKKCDDPSQWKDTSSLL